MPADSNLTRPVLRDNGHLALPTEHRPSAYAILKGMRDPQTVEEELMEISSISDDSIKLERIIAWCATYPDEVPFAMRLLMGMRTS